MNPDTTSISQPSTGSHAGPCPLCRTPLPAASGPVETDEMGASVAFRSCPTCATLVPEPVQGDPSVHATGTDHAPHGRQLADDIAADAASAAWEMVEHLPPPAEAGPILDLGMGRGAMPAALQRLGYETKGCEPSAFLSQMARASFLLGPDVLTTAEPQTYLDEIEAEEQTFEAAILWHVIDRQQDPIGLLRRCLGLVPGGHLFLEFPTVGPGTVLAAQRFHPTPRTAIHLAEQLGLDCTGLSIASTGGLRAFFRVPSPSVVDLDHRSTTTIDVASLERTYRATSPVFAHFSPAPEPLDLNDDAELGTLR